MLNEARQLPGFSYTDYSMPLFLEDLTMKFVDTDSLLTIVASADEAGRINMRCARGDNVRNLAEARELLEIAFMEQSLLTIRIEAVKKAISELDIRISQYEGRPIVSLCLAKLLQLPAVNPAAELAEFEAMLVEMKAFFLARPTQHCSIQICNERDRNRRVYGSIVCRYPDPELRQGTCHDTAATQALVARINASPALSHWLRRVALSLQKLGPWSWLLIREDVLFGYGLGPYHEHLRSEYDKLPPEPDTRKYRVLDID